MTMPSINFFFIIDVFNKYNIVHNANSSKETKMKDRLKMADTLLSKYGADPN